MNPALHLNVRLLAIAFVLETMAAPGRVGRAAEIDSSRLPPAAAREVVFAQDIAPLLQARCIRCHGPERPKSHFRLDNRDSALKGGDNGIDILPGQSGKSPLVWYVAGLVPDMQMPPPGKGEPLSGLQVGLLRAWIDQGANWQVSNAVPAFLFSASPALRYVSVQGSHRKFREIEGIKEGAGGGLEEFSARNRLSQDAELFVEGRAIVPDADYSLKLELRKTDLAFLRAGLREWRRYYDDAGWFYRPFDPQAFRLGRDLYLDTGAAWFDAGLTLPDIPQVVVGYEYQFKDGDKSTLEWGNVGGKNIYPASEAIHERVHIAKIDVTHDIFGFHIEENARVELYSSRTRHDDAFAFSTGPFPDSWSRSSYGATHVQGMNTFRLERQVMEEWLLTGGYLYSRLDGDASLDQITVTSAGNLAPGTFWASDTTLLRRDSHIVSVGSLVLPWETLSLSVGGQGEWTRQEGFGRINLEEGDPYVPAGVSRYPASVESNLDKQAWSENAMLRLTSIPGTVLFAEARLDQDRIGQFESDLQDAGTTPDSSSAFLRNTDYKNDRREFRAGFNTSPLSWVSLNAHYKERDSESDYDNRKIAIDPAGYPAFIRARSIETDEVAAKLVIRPRTWLRTVFTYQLTASDYSTTTEPVPGAVADSTFTAGNYDAHTCGINVTVTPFQRMYFSGAFTYTDSRTVTLEPADRSVVPYRGNIFTVLGSGTFSFDAATTLQANYSFSRAAYGQNNLVTGLPLGLDYTRHALSLILRYTFSPLANARVGYGFYDYREPTMGRLNDYVAHGVFGALTIHWP